MLVNCYAEKRAIVVIFPIENVKDKQMTTYTRTEEKTLKIKYI